MPSAAPARSTAKVCPVTGTGVKPRGMRIWAQIAVSRAKPTTSVAFLTKTFVRASGRAQMSVITSAEVLFVIALSVSSFKGCLLQS